jgi:hypothetical protein
MNNKEKTKIITAINYIKVLLEEDRLGESIKYINLLKNDIESESDVLIMKLEGDLIINKEQLKTKPGNFIYIHDMWFKLISLNKNDRTIHLEARPGVEINKKYTILNESTVKTS